MRSFVVVVAVVGFFTSQYMWWSLCLYTIFWPREDKLCWQCILQCHEKNYISLKQKQERKEKKRDFYAWNRTIDISQRSVIPICNDNLMIYTSFSILMYEFLYISFSYNEVFISQTSDIHIAQIYHMDRANSVSTFLFCLVLLHVLDCAIIKKKKTFFVVLSLL